MIYLLTAIGLSPGGSITVHISTQTIHRTTQVTTNLEECGPCPVLANFTLAFAVQLRKKSGKTSVRLRKTSVRVKKTSLSVLYTYYLNTHTLQNQTHTHAHTHTHTPPLTHKPPPRTRTHTHPPTHTPTPPPTPPPTKYKTI